MKLQRFTARTPPPRETGLARAQDIGALTRTGDVAVWRGVSQIGRGMQAAAGLGFEAYQRRQRLDDDIEMGKASQREQEIFNQRYIEADALDVTMDMPLPDDPDYYKTLTAFSTKKRDELLKDALKDIDNDIGKLSQGFSRPEAKARFEKWHNANYTNFVDSLREMHDDKLHSYQRAEILKLAEDAARNADVKTANSYIDAMDKTELITPEKALAFKKQLQAISDRAEKDIVRNALWGVATAATRPDGEVDWEQAAQWLSIAENIKGIDPAIIDSLSEDIRTQLSQQERRDAKKLDQAQEEQRDNIYAMIDANDENTLNNINSSDLLAKEKAALRKLARNPVIPLDYPEYDKVRDIIDGVALGTHTEEQADKAIKDGVGKYFDTGIARSLRNTLSGKSEVGGALKRPVHTRGITTIEEVYDAYIKAKEPDFEEMSELLQRKQRLKNDLDAFTLEKDRTDEEIEKKVKLLVAPVKDEATHHWLRQFLTPPIWKVHKILRARKALREKQGKKVADVRLESAPLIEFDKVWPSLTNKQKTNIWSALDNGYTSQEILSALEK